MHRRALSMIALIVILPMTFTSMVSLAGGVVSGSQLHRVPARSVIQGTPTGIADFAGGNLVVTIVASAKQDEYEFRVSEEEADGFIVWHNVSSADHHLNISMQGVVTSKVELEHGETFHMRPEQGGMLHYECTTHGESGSLHIE